MAKRIFGGVGRIEVELGGRTVDGFRFERQFDSRSDRAEAAWPKYLPENRWHIERWTAPECYGTPEQWHRKHERGGGWGASSSVGTVSFARGVRALLYSGRGARRIPCN